ncbi:MAG TPA: VOC family protein [Phototrophicaceae bacterium]|nr:VOC family protein [Phototrophicaceae bacterium]
MGLELYMVGVIVREMPRAVEFYRRLGVDVPEGSETRDHVEVKMSGMTFFLNTNRGRARFDPNRAEDTSSSYRMILEFYLKTRAAVEAKYNEMVGYGYTSRAAPYNVSKEMCFALIDDPDGNAILLSGMNEDAG